MDVTEQQQQQLDNTEISFSNDESLNALIEKVVKEQIEKLAGELKDETNLPNVHTEVMEIDLAQSSDDDASSSSSSENEVKQEEDETEKEALDDISSIDDTATETTTSIIESVDLDSTITNLPETTTNIDVASTDVEEADVTNPNSVEEIYENEEVDDDDDDDDNKVSDDDVYTIPETLTNAVEDLLSSVLGMTVDSIYGASKFIETASNSAIEEEQNLHTTTTMATTVTAAADENEITVQQDVSTNSENAGQQMSEVDLKIENLEQNIQQSGFMTENTPEIYAETVSNFNDDDEEMLEALAPVTDEENSRMKPVSIEDSVNHVMNLVKGTEGRLALQNAQNVVDSILIDKHIKGHESGFYVEKSIPAQNNFDAEMIKSFETDINEMMINPSIEDHEEFEPNMAKAALMHRFMYGEDFK